LQSILSIYPLKPVSFIKFCASGQFHLPGQTVGLAGQRAGALFFCSAPRLFHRDTKLHCHLSGLAAVSKLQRDPKLTAVFRDWQKTSHRDADGT
jgi:hypothetical protein